MAVDFRSLMVDAGRARAPDPARFLASAAHGDQPSYVQRGVFVLENCSVRDLPDPPPDAAQRQPAFPANASQRQKSTAIRAVPECGVCHSMIDPIGLAFDAYDEIGRLRSALPARKGEGRRSERRGAHRSARSRTAPSMAPSSWRASWPRAAETAACLARQWFRFATSRLDGADSLRGGQPDQRRWRTADRTCASWSWRCTAQDEFRYPPAGRCAMKIDPSHPAPRRGRRHPGAALPRGHRPRPSRRRRCGLVVFVHGQGTVAARWRPAQVGPTFELPQLLQPLAPYKAKLNVWSEIHNNVRKLMGGNGHNAPGARS
jgi:hypothetical protein